jgi:hypothetical protein
VAQAELIPLLALHLLLTGLPGVAAVLTAVRRGIKDVPILLVLGLAASGCVAMLGFWIFYGDPDAGKAFAYAVPAVSIAVIGWTLRGDALDRRLLRALGSPLCLWVFGTCFLVFLGFMHGGSATPLRTAGTRFTWQLPQDNILPWHFTTWFYAHGHSGTPPPYGNWIASDRPPLQIGYVLMQRPFGWANDVLNYQLLGVALQQLWIVGLYALLTAAGLGRVTRALVMIMVLVSDLAVVNGFYVWPKLLPASMLLGAAALVVPRYWRNTRRSYWGATLIAVLCALAMLGHGSSAFAIIPLAIFAALRGLPSWRWLAVAVAVGVVLLAPWSAYQRYGDPPGNRLTKWILAGDAGVDRNSTGQAILDGYRNAGIGETLHNKGRNFLTILGASSGSTVQAALNTRRLGEAGQIVMGARALVFFYLVPSWGLLLIAPALMVLGRRRSSRSPPEWAAAKAWYLVLAIGCLVWGLLMFGNTPSQPVIHQGTYFLPILGFCAAIAGLRATFPRLALWLVAANALISLAINVPVLKPPLNSTYSPAAILICAASLIAFAATAAGPDELVSQLSARLRRQRLLGLVRG